MQELTGSSENTAYPFAPPRLLPLGLEPASLERTTIMGKDFEWFCNPHGRLTTSTGVPYNELFSTEEIRRLTFTRFLASKNQELSPVIDERQTSEQPEPAADSPMSRWLSLGVELFWYPPFVMAALLTNYSRLSPWGFWLRGHDWTTGQAGPQSVTKKSID